MARLAEFGLDGQPLEPTEVVPLLREAFAGTGIVLAVSGGPDSTALMHLVSEIAATAPLPPVHVATVDHGLRDSSRAEAAAVSERAKLLGLRSHVLTWADPKPSTGIQAAARRARYALLLELCHRVGASHLLTAHTLDDQAETVLIRMSRGSSPAGLAGMRSIVMRETTVHLRPFLRIPKSRLLASCEAGGWPFFLDPANHDLGSARGRWRRLMPLLATEGLDARRLGRLAERLQVADAAIAAKAAAALALCCAASSDDRTTLHLDLLMREPAAIVLRAMGTVLTGFARPGPPRHERLESIVAALTRAHARGFALRRTLHGALLDFSPRDGLMLSREGVRRRGTAVPEGSRGG